MKKKNILLLIPLFSSLLGYGQVTNVTFLNTGKMNVAPGGKNGVGLFVPDAIRMVGSEVEIAHNGITELGGNFYQDATTNVFDVGGASFDVPSPTTPSSGTFRFVSTRGVNRYITTQSVDINTFDRGSYYIAFPKVELSTTDSVVLPGRMGIDAKSLHRTTPDQGFLILRSENISGKDYDASFRITNAGSSSALVDLGSVVVERDMTLYRGMSASPPLFAFATPYNNTQYSGYFAGNWVRKPEVDATTGHTRYVLGNKPDPSDPSNTLIARDQYVIYPSITLDASRAYLIQPRPAGYNYADLQAENGLGVTGDVAAAYNKGKFYFNGKVYTLPAYKEQLFAEDNLYSHNLTVSQTTTLNWLVGNSYTSPLSTKLIAKKLEASGMTFSPVMYVFPAGSTSYQPLDITGSGTGIAVATYDEIPAMSIFMVRVSKSNTATGTLTIGKSEQIHGNIAHNVANAPKYQGGPSSGSTAVPFTNQIVFKVASMTNEYVYDLAAIGLRDGSTMESDEFDIAKVPGNDFAFQLYTLSSGNSKLAANGVPLNAESVILALKPASAEDMYKLTPQYAETLTSEGLWLKDNATNVITDLKLNSEYLFQSAPGDDPNRFVVYFKKPAGYTGETTTGISVVSVEDKITLLNLTETDVNSRAIVYDMTGKMLVSDQITSYPAFDLREGNLLPGAYIVQIEGARNASLKFIKKKLY
ncbi:MAG: T9SS type A sorting domain-containing protein [Paludibacteraceae bacterium]